MFHGVIPPLCTPLTDDGEVDTVSLERLTAFQLDAGVHGLFVGGSTGEVAQLTDAARDTALRTVVATAAGQVPVLAGAIDTGTLRVLDARPARPGARRRRGGGHRALLRRRRRGGGSRPLPTLHAALDLPLVAYDIPSNVGYKLPSGLVAELAQEKVIVAVKDSSRRPGGLPAGAGRHGGQRRRVPDRLGDARRPRDGPRRRRDRARARQRRPARLCAALPGRRAPGTSPPRGPNSGGSPSCSASSRSPIPARVGRISAALGAFKAALVARGVIRSGRTQAPLLPLTAAEVRPCGHGSPPPAWASRPPAPPRCMHGVALGHARSGRGSAGWLARLPQRRPQARRLWGSRVLHQRPANHRAQAPRGALLATASGGNRGARNRIQRRTPAEDWAT